MNLAKKQSDGTKFEEMIWSSRCDYLILELAWGHVALGNNQRRIEIKSPSMQECYKCTVTESNNLPIDWQKTPNVESIARGKENFETHCSLKICSIAPVKSGKNL